MPYSEECSGGGVGLTHFCPPLRFRNQVPTFAVRETDVSRYNGGTSGAPIMPRDAVFRTAHVGTVGKNGLNPSCTGEFHRGALIWPP